MKRSALKLGMFLLSVIALWSCAYDKDMAYLKRSGHRPESEGRKDRGGHGYQISTIRTSQGDTRVEIDNIRGEMQKLQGRVEDNERITRRAVERDLGDQDSVKKGVVDLNRRINGIGGGGQSPFGLSRMSHRARKPRQRPRPRLSRPGRSPHPLFRRNPETKDAELYDRSLALFKEGKHEEAITELQGFFEEIPEVRARGQRPFLGG